MTNNAQKTAGWKEISFRLAWIGVAGFAGIGCASPPPAAAPAAGNEVSVQQPDGSSLTVKAQGDEWNNWMETSDGYTVKRGCDNVWYYVRSYETNGQAILDETPANQPPPTHLKKHIVPTQKGSNEADSTCR